MDILIEFFSLCQCLDVAYLIFYIDEASDIFSDLKDGAEEILHISKTVQITNNKFNILTLLSISIANWPHSIGEAKMKKDIKLALTVWGKYGRLRFEEVNGPHADIIVAFGKEYHGDR